MNVLVVDDDDIFLMLISELLVEMGYTPVLASSAAEALDQIEVFEISIVIVDWEMPVTDGVELCRIIRSSEVRKYLYLIMCSARSDKACILEALEAGADDYIHKPLDEHELAIRLQGAKRVITLQCILDEKNRKLTESTRVRNRQLINQNDQITRAFTEITADLRVAARMQSALLPKEKELGRVNANWMFRPASYMAGDMFDFFLMNDTQLVFYIIDVEGHGIPSALLSFAVNNQIKPNFHGICGRQLRQSDDLDSAVRSTVGELNNLFTFDETDSKYFTMIYGILDTKTGEVVVAHAGHPPAIHFSKRENQAVEIGTGGIPMGLFENSDYETQTFNMQPGDRLFMYSDGTFECTNPQGVMYGESRLRERIMAWSEQPIGKIGDLFDDEFVGWNGNKTFADDVSLMCLEYR